MRFLSIILGVAEGPFKTIILVLGCQAFNRDFHYKSVAFIRDF